MYANILNLTALEATRQLLAQPSGDTRQGRCDAVLLALLYDSGARVQEPVDLRVGVGSRRQVWLP